MEDRDREVAYQLLGILQRYAATSAEQAAMASAYNQMQSHGLSQPEVVARLAGFLHDGTAYGNWPWAETRVETRTSQAVYRQRAGKESLSK